MKQRDLLELFLLGGIWGASFLFMRVAAPQFGPIALIEVRVGLAAILLLALGAARGELDELRKNWANLLFVGIFNSALPFTLFAYATLTLPAGYASVLNATSPLFSAIIAAMWLSEPMPPRKLGGLAIGFTGVLILVSEKLTRFDDRLAVLAGLTAAFAYGLVASYAKRRLAHVRPFTVASGSLLWAALCLLPLAIATWPATSPTALGWSSAIFLAVVCTAIAYVLYFRLLARLGPVRASTVAYLIPIFGMVWGYVFLQEAITWRMLLGAAVTLFGLYLMASTKANTASRTN